MVHVTMYTPLFPHVRNRHCLRWPERYGMRQRRVIAGDERYDATGKAGTAGRRVGITGAGREEPGATWGRATSGVRTNAERVSVGWSELKGTHATKTSPGSWARH
jgi:hypothetical protein